MSALSPILRSVHHGSIGFWCPGCDQMHVVRVVEPAPWGYNGDPDRPTFTPSILVKSGHFGPSGDKGCWCKFNAGKIAKGEEPSGFKCTCCHSHVTDGRIQYLDDCSHALAGQTVDLPEFPL